MEDAAGKPEAAEALAAYLEHADAIAHLTPRECKIGGLIAAGIRFQKVAEILDISVKTIDMSLVSAFARIAAEDGRWGEDGSVGVQALRNQFLTEESAEESEVADALASYVAPADEAAQLTFREHRVRRLIARGHTFWKTAEILDTSATTLDNHLASIFAKMASGDDGRGQDGSAGVREPRNPHPPTDSAAATADPDHEASGPNPE